jgi:hypothetical protein
MIWAWTLCWAVVATILEVLAPERMRLMVPVTSVGELVIPFGHWIIVSLWTAGALWICGASRTLLWRCVGVALAWHALVLLALFVPRLSDRAAFSASIYRVYATAFCAGASAVATAWLLDWARRLREPTSAAAALETPLLIGWIVLVWALARFDPALAAMSLIAGGALAAARRGVPALRLRVASLRRAAHDNDRVFVIVVFLAALAVRLLYVTRIMQDADYLDAGSDGRVYDDLAWSIASGRGIPSWFGDRFPLLLLGYVYFVAAVYKIAGHSYVAITTVQAALGAAACVLLYDLANRLLGRTVARVTALFTAVSFPLVFAAATIGHQALDVFLTVLIAWMAVRMIGASATPTGWAASGVVVGLSIAVRETNLFLAAFLMAWIAWTNVAGWKRSLPHVAAFVSGVAVIALPFVAPKVWTAADRQAMRGHLDRLYRGEGEVRDTPRMHIVGPLSDPAAALAQLQSEPVRVAGALARAYAANIAVQFLTQPYGGFDLVFLRKGTEYYYGMWFYAYALTVAGAIVLLHRMRSGSPPASAVVLILGVIVSRTFPHVVLESGYRHRVPIEPFLILLASVGVTALAARLMTTAATPAAVGDIR